MATKKQTPLEKALRKIEKQQNQIKEMAASFIDLNNVHNELQVINKNLNGQLSAAKSENAALRSDTRIMRDRNRDFNIVTDVMRKERETLLKVMDKLVS